MEQHNLHHTGHLLSTNHGGLIMTTHMDKVYHSA